MIQQVIDVEHYWRVVIFYNWDGNFLCNAVHELHHAGFTKDFIGEVLAVMWLGLAKAVTCSNTNTHTSIVIFNPHGTSEDYINSIVHEAEHVKQAMLYAYEVEDAGEPPAYTIGYLVMRMYGVFKNIVGFH